MAVKTERERELINRSVNSITTEINVSTDLCIVVLGPLNAIKKITEIGFDRNVVLVRHEPLVEELVVLRLLLQDNRVAGKQVRKSVCRHRSVDVHLVLVLTTKQLFCQSSFGNASRICC